MQRTTPHFRSAGISATVSAGSVFSIPLSLPVARRGGAVIIVVLAMLSLMMFLGVFFFEFVQEELTAAGNYATNPYDELLNPDEFFEEAESQLIIGPDSNRTMSALSAGDTFATSPPAGLSYGQPGTPHPLLAHVIGRVRPKNTGSPAALAELEPSDVLPHNGHGISVQFIDNSVPVDGLFGPGDYALFDMDGDGSPDATLPSEDTDGNGVLGPGEDVIIVNGRLDPAFGVNFSRPAQNDPSVDAFGQLPNFALRPFQPDVDYTYPDINNLFLAYDRIDLSTGRRILVPSFFRPDLFPAKRSSNFSDLYTDSNTKRLVLRPHSGHKYSDNVTSRFLSEYTQAQSGNLDRVIGPFPMTVDFDGDGISNEMGVYSDPSSNAGYDLDVDLTGDGEPEGIWMDLGLGLYDMADGRQFVPLFSYYILDADSLINLNAHGNLREGYYDGSVAYTAAPFSLSNTGASVSEVNPIRALTGNPADFSGQNDLSFVQNEHAFYFGFNPTVVQNRATMANMELSFLLRGRPLSRSLAPLTGRYGEESYVSRALPASPTNLFPRPGYTGNGGYDDDSDNLPDDPRYRGGARRYPSLYDPRLAGSANVVVPAASHPVDPHGSGANAYTSSGRDLVAGVAGSPVVWPSYLQGWEAPLASGGGTVAPIEAAYPYGGPLYANGTSTVIDEEDETRLSSPDRRADDIFQADENLALQVADSDFLRVGGTSRVKALAPFNFSYSREATAIRKRFTTDSWDLSELTYTPWRYVSGARTETSVWTGAIAVSTGLPTGPTHLFFPPEFGTTLGATIFQANDPIRPEVRALLATEDTNTVNLVGYGRRESLTLPLISGASGSGTAQLWRQPLNLNKLLVGFNASGYPIFRDLMPHPDMVALEYVQPGTGADLMPAITIPTMIHDHNASIPATAELSNIISSPATEADRAQTATAQEWWARYDRQRMARDIYTLLYLVGAPDIDFDVSTPLVKDGPATKPYPSSIKTEMTREMAQFAVNYVDSLDRDDVITKFEYDDDLSDGWNSTPTRYVYGIERASLTFSEVEFLQTKPQSSDYATTLHDETTDVHQYLHMELRNSSPFTVNLAEGWRISRVVTGTGTPDISFEFKSNGFGTGSPPSVDPTKAKQVFPGANFLIGTHDGTVKNASSVVVSSDVFADYKNGGQLESILPESTVTIADNTISPTPQTDLDLGGGVAANTRGDDQYYYPPAAPTLVAPSVYAVTNTKLVERIPSPAVPVQVRFDLVLERRQNLNGIETTPNTPTSSSMGDWIEVDRFHVDSDDMDTLTQFAQLNPASDVQADVASAFQTLNSVERRQSFDPVQDNHLATASINHTISADVATKHSANSALGKLAIPLTQFSLWQPHFDRDFTSAYELLSVPLYGNWPLTEISVAANTNDGYGTNNFYKEIHGGTQFNLAPGSSGTASGRLSGDFTAGMRFNFPNGLPGQPYQGWNVFNYQNAWYRLFDFVTVPRRADQQSEELISGVAGSTKPVFRVPGKINLNTLRDETVLAALLDDETHLSYGGAYATNDNLTANRNWFLELLQSRDGTDFFAKAAGVPQLALPNSIDSRPFRNASKPDPYATATVDDAVENGLLRSTNRRGGTELNPRPAGVSYSAPTLSTPANFTSTGLWSGPPPHDPGPVTPTSWQGLFDAGDLTTSTGLDHHTRSRILAKIANNSTTKSHVFFVWTAVGYFEAHRESTNNRVQIGARISDIPIHRRFTVVDMSKLDEAYDNSNNTFKASKFIIFQKRLR